MESQLMRRITSPAGARVSYVTSGSGPPLVLVHGALSDPQTNWEFVKPLFERQFTVHAIARRGRGETDGTAGHSLEDEGRDVAAVIRAVGEPVFLLGHSYGALGTLSPRSLYVTDALAAVLPDVCIQKLPGQAHEAMGTAPAMYAEAVARVLLSEPRSSAS